MTESLTFPNALVENPDTIFYNIVGNFVPPEWRNLTNNCGIVNSGEVDARSDGATPISNRRATSDDVTNFSSIDYKQLSKTSRQLLSLIVSRLQFEVVEI